MTITYHGKHFYDQGIEISPFTAWRLRRDADEIAAPRLAKLDLMLARSRSLGQRFLEMPPIKDGAPTLRPFQLVPRYYSKFVGDFLIADDSGTGKTLEAIDVINSDQAKSVLVICPAHKREDWATELERSTTLPRTQIVYGDADVAGRPKVLAISWNMVSDRSVYDWLLALRFGIVVLDEIHHAKNGNAARTKHALSLAVRRTQRIIGLSGTYPPNAPHELYPALRAFMGEKIISRQNFIDTFCVVAYYKRRKRIGRKLVEVGQKKQFVVGSKNEEELQWRLRTKLMVRRTISDCLPQMPPPIIRLQILTITRNLQVLHEEERAYAREYLTESGSVRKLPVEDYAELRHKIAAAKAPFVIEYAKKILEKERKVIILAHHRIMVEEVAKGLIDYGMVKILGGITAKKKHEYKEQFQTDDATRVCVGNIKSCGESIDLFASSYGIGAEASWSPGDNDQCVGRIRRYGQMEQVRWDWLVVQGSLDAKVLRRAMKKAESLEKIKDAKIEGEQEWLSV